MNSFNSILLLVLTTISYLVVSQQQQHQQETPLLINCGLPKLTTSTTLDKRVWRSDDDTAFAPPNIDAISNTVTSATAGDPPGPPYTTARMFNSTLSYSFSISPGNGPIFLRLYFFTSASSYNNDLISPTKSYFSLIANNNLTLLQNFNPFLINPSQNFIEFHITLQNRTNNNLNLTFFPGDITNKCTTCYYGFINGIEIVSVPKGLYINETTQIHYITNPTQGYIISTTLALQTAYRINVGGTKVVESSKDLAGVMMRAWYRDFDGYLINTGVLTSEGGVNMTNTPVVHYKTIPGYVAPTDVYATIRIFQNEASKANIGKNMTWQFDVDPGFDYLVRLHFCERLLNINKSGQRLFSIYIGGSMAEPSLDVWVESGGTDAAMYKDYVTSVGGVSNGTKVPLLLALRSVSVRDLLVYSPIISGVEIFKVSLPNGSLAVPNPPSNGANSPGPGQASNGKHHALPIIGGAIGGLLVSLLIVTCLALYRRKAKNSTLMPTKSSSKGQYWLPTSEHSDSTATTINASSGPSLPSDLCRRFSFAQIRVATSDFDENLIIGTGGFGKVYKGTIDGGTTAVAIKRLNATSKQGVHEFRTEIEMLSRLRHVHLVSLIGYSEEQGEMSLVYEYMPRGTLRDHLGYKDKNNDDETTLSWKQRLTICLGSARGLHYLHAGAKELIIHRDVKSTNILLDDKWAAKVSDFGLSKVGPANESGLGHVSTAVKGSVGYLDPEYYRRQQLTEKSDVYSFGVVLFEVLCARPAVNPNLPREQVNLAMWARSRYKSGTLDTIVDPKLTGQIAPECLRKFGEIADSCVRDRGSDRPSMGDVVWSLEFALQLQETAERNNVDGSHPMREIKGPGNDGYDGITDEDVFSNSLGKDFSQSNSAGGLGNWRNGSMISTTNDTDYHLKSDSVFTEIVDQQAR